MERNYSKVGDKNLKILSEMKQFTDWMYQEVRPYLKEDILEIGSGLGTYSEKIINDFPQSSITLSDIDPNYLQNLRTKFLRNPRVSVAKIDLGLADDFVDLKESFDSILALNVLEHVEDDIQGLKTWGSHCGPKGRLLFLYQRIASFLIISIITWDIIVAIPMLNCIKKLLIQI